MITTRSGPDRVARGAAAPLQEVDPETLHRWLEAGEATLIDVREADEHACERIPGAVPVPLSRLDLDRVPRTGRVVLHCRTGVRSAEAGAKLLAAGYPEVIHLRGGLRAWERAGYDVLRAPRAVIPIMRQVQITVGAVVSLSVLLGVLLSPWWLIPAGFMGLGLLFAGISGTCGLAAVLRRMPWNRTPPCELIGKET